jgi:hypothetical protein
MELANVLASRAEVLFRALRIKSLALKNRIVMAPMTRSFAPNGVPGDANVAYYRRRAEGGIGLITAMTAAGVPDEYGNVLRALTETIASGHGSRPNDDVVTVTGTPPTRFEEFAARTAGAWR